MRSPIEDDEIFNYARIVDKTLEISDDYSNDIAVFSIRFCPMCGKKLNEWKGRVEDGYQCVQA